MTNKNMVRRWAVDDARRGKPKSHGATCSGSWTPEYRAWVSMKTRCSTKYVDREDYKNYCARGIVVCPRWIDDFAAFLADVGPRPSNRHSLDRYPDNDGNYEPSNVRWATTAEQAVNRRNNHRVVYHGQPMTLTEAVCAAGFASNFRNASYRIKRGWSTERAVETPTKKYRAVAAGAGVAA